MNSFSFEPIYGSTLFAVFVAIILVVVLVWITPPTENPVRRRWILVLRGIAAAVLLLSVFRPTLVRSSDEVGDATLVVAIDTSRSMTLPSDESSDRWTQQVEAWRTLATGLEALDENVNVTLIQYDAKAEVVSESNSNTLDSVLPKGAETNLAAATNQAVILSRGQPLTGFVLMGDGTQTATVIGTTAREVAQTFDAWGVPFWSVPIGPVADMSDARDVEIDALPETFQLFAGNEFEVSFEVALRGLANIEVPLEISWIDENQKSDVVVTRRLVSDSAREIKSFRIPIRSPKPGVYRLEVRAKKQTGELVTANNLQTAFVTVREGGGRILYIEGTPRLEQATLLRTLRGFPDLDITYQWIPNDTADRWPIDLSNVIREGQFDIYIIGDLDADAVGVEQWSRVAENISNGAGLMMLGGFQTFGAGGYATSPLKEVLPIELVASRRRSLDVDRDNQMSEQIEGPIVVLPAKPHPITAIGGNDPTGTWGSLPPQRGAYRFSDPKVAPGVEVLLKSGDNAPMLVVGEYGNGRVATTAFDSTWQWWRSGQSQLHRRFWRQLVLWLLSREEESGDRIHVKLDARRFEGDAQPEFTATVSDSVGQINLVAEVVGENGNVRKLDEIRQTIRPGETSIAGSLPELEPGYYQLRVFSNDSAFKLKEERLPFQVVDRSRELASPMADPFYLSQLAEITSAHGGRAFSYDEMPQLLEQIARRQKLTKTKVTETYTLGNDPTTGWLMFVVFTIALTIEWLLRRRWGLV